jgi:hypothetical protein
LIGPSCPLLLSINQDGRGWEGAAAGPEPPFFFDQVYLSKKDLQTLEYSLTIVRGMVKTDISGGDWRFNHLR